MRLAARTSALSLPCLLALGACASTGDLGSVPEDLVGLYDVVQPTGVIEVEIDRDGAIREMEAEVPLESLPPRVVAAARARYPQGRVVGGERELTREGAGWEVKLEDRGILIELVYDEEGELVELERELERSEAPGTLIESAQSAIGGGDFRSVELVERGETQVYHVKLDLGGASYKVILAPDGEVIRKVREQRAEIEIPLR